MLIGWKHGDRIHLPLPPREGAPLEEVSAEEFPSLDAGIAGQFGYTRTTDYRGHDVLVSYRPLGTAFPNWGLIAKLDAAEAYEPVARLRRLLLTLGAGLLLLGLGASNAIARRVARPIRHLARTSAAVAAGDLTARSRVDSSDELGELSLAFNRMTDELARSQTTLERRISERTRALVAVRDLLDAFFRISTSRLDPDNIDKTFDSVLRFCSELGYDLAMISLVDREAGVIRAVRATGTHDRHRRPDRAAARGKRYPGRRGPRESRDRHPRLHDRPAVRPDHRRPVGHSRACGPADGQRPDPRHPPGGHARAPWTPTASICAPWRPWPPTRRAPWPGSGSSRRSAGSTRAWSSMPRSCCARRWPYREQTRILQSVLDCMGDGVVVADAQGRFLVFNPAARADPRSGPDRQARPASGRGNTTSSSPIA